MNWFDRLINNPNFHARAAAVLNAAQPVAFALGHPEVGIAISAVGVATGLQAAAIPENPAAPIPGLPVGGPVIHLPPAAAGGSYHASDWMNLAALLARQFAPTKP